VIGAASQSLASTALSNHVSVSIDVAENIGISIERSPMERVFENLIANAIEAMPDGGSIRIMAERNDSAVVVTVEDTGPGIPAVLAPHLFQPFATAGKKTGMGPPQDRSLKVAAPNEAHRHTPSRDRKRLADSPLTT